MRISELASRTGFTVATIKYYLREVILPAGTRTSSNQAQYSEAHERRLTLIRALSDTGRLSICSIRDILAAADQPVLTRSGLGVAVLRNLPGPELTVDDAPRRRARQQVTDLIDRRRWQVDPTCAAIEHVVAVLAVMDKLGQPSDSDWLDAIGLACESAASAELEFIDRTDDTNNLPENISARAVLIEATLIGIQRLAQEHLLTLRLNREELMRPRHRPQAAPTPR